MTTDVVATNNDLAGVIIIVVLNVSTFDAHQYWFNYSGDGKSKKAMKKEAKDAAKAAKKQATQVNICVIMLF